jgi:transposase
MAAPYSVDLRLRVIKACERGDGSKKEIAKAFDLGIRTVARYWKQYKERGSVLPAEYKRGAKPAVDEKQMLRIKELVLQWPDASLNELCRRYNKSRNKKIGISIMFRAISKLGFRRKKKSLYAAQQDMPEVKKTEKNLSQRLVN